MYTVEIYKTDRRTKSGERLVFKRDHATDNRSVLERAVQESLGSNERYEIHETWVTRKNAINDQEFQERYDTAYSCSPSSEAYWSM